VAYFIFVVMSVGEDFYCGIFKLMTHCLPSIAALKWLITEDTQEAHEIVLVHYMLRKQSQFTITISFYAYCILIYNYWNSALFGPSVNSKTNFTSICYLIPITIVIDLVCCMVTMFFASRMKRNYNMMNLLDRLYSYPKLRSFVIVMTTVAMQLLFLTMFDLNLVVGSQI